MQQKENPERSLLFMTAAGVVCQTTSQGWYGWCVAMLTLLATGVQGQDMNTPGEPNDRLVEEMITIADINGLGTLVSQDMPTRKPPQQTPREGQKQPSTPEDNPRCEDTKHRLERAESSLLFLTAAGAVCQIGNHEWYCMCC